MKNIKTILTITIMLLTANIMHAQDGENELKNFRFGLKFTPSVNWYKPDGKIIEPNGAAIKYGGGLILEFRLASVVSVQTGLQIDVNGGKTKYNNGGLSNPNANTVSYYYQNVDDKISKYDSLLAYSLSHTHYQLNERSYNITYITIPLALKMKTKEIGSLTYFGVIGINNSFRWKANANDKLTVIDDVTHTLAATASKSKVDVTKDISFYTASLNFGLGTELNLAGSTSLTFGLNYNLGFTNVVKKESDYLERRANNALGLGTFSDMPQKLKSNAVVLTVGVLF
jgi:hypothetical protein